MNRELGCIDELNANYPKRDIIIERENYQAVFNKIKELDVRTLIVQAQAKERNKIIRKFLNDNSITEDAFYETRFEDLLRNKNVGQMGR